ncbi:hypothetical protein ABZU09_06300 [Lactobacillus mulieris]|jgi:hypothetical protein|uniref:Uncharacterized protein n=1 Tax=Lactobacillus mulieris TaxID=2508708 RepID=A0AAW5WW27_9LACO|nr:hypothetical protein [Lactobacillus mulieris]MCF1847323.1 hypothetical protein [Lactobacillus mulieris]MCZ3876675.1 hypothetical protein [Lactobacillus mulieris]MCZ3900070.1 hypothetical protein [Lactobacillus mulieris]MCZ9677556.1 hypothetical protein [Lactobacillus mulieris]WEB30361.1 hypothetical protein PUW59_06345 [Lactobacillus mulieris]
MKIKTVYLDLVDDYLDDAIEALFEKLVGNTVLSSFYDDDKEQLEIQYLEKD